MDSSQQNYNPSENYNNDDSPQNNQEKKGKGRKKTTNKKIENKTSRQVSFSKRRSGLFKKANEIGTLCGTESVVIVHSPAGKVHSFGSPNVERVAHRFLNPTENVHGQMVDDGVMGEHDEELADLERQLALEKKYQKESLRMQKKMQDQEGIPTDLDELNFQQLEVLMNRASSVKMDFEWEDLKHNSNVVFSDNPAANYDPNATYFTGNTNSSFDEPFNNAIPSNLSLPLPSPYSPRASGSSPVFSFDQYGNHGDSFHCGNHGDASILNDGEIGGTSMGAKRGRHNNGGGRRG